MTIRQVIHYHIKLYPLMQTSDAVKLVYQNEFGCGHFVEDPQISLERLEKEYNAVQPDRSNDLITPIGNGFTRINLSALDTEQLPLAKLNDIFVGSSILTKGTLDSFRSKLSILTSLADEGIFAFSTSDLKDYLAEYEQMGFPPVSHSSEYRNLYKPAYRVVSEELFFEIFVDMKYIDAV